MAAKCPTRYTLNSHWTKLLLECLDNLFNVYARGDENAITQLNELLFQEGTGGTLTQFCVGNWKLLLPLLEEGPMEMFTRSKVEKVIHVHQHCGHSRFSQTRLFTAKLRCEVGVQEVPEVPIPAWEPCLCPGRFFKKTNGELCKYTRMGSLWLRDLQKGIFDVQRCQQWSVLATILLLDVEGVTRGANLLYVHLLKCHRAWWWRIHEPPGDFFASTALWTAPRTHKASFASQAWPALPS